MAWSGESRFLIHHVDAQVNVRRLPAGRDDNMEGMQVGGGSVIHPDITLTSTTYLNTVVLTSFSRIMHPAILQKMV